MSKQNNLICSFGTFQIDLFKLLCSQIELSNNSKQKVQAITSNYQWEIGADRMKPNTKTMITDLMMRQQSLLQPNVIPFRLTVTRKDKTLERKTNETLAKCKNLVRFVKLVKRRRFKKELIDRVEQSKQTDSAFTVSTQTRQTNQTQTCSEHTRAYVSCRKQRDQQQTRQAACMSPSARCVN